MGQSAAVRRFFVLPQEVTPSPQRGKTLRKKVSLRHLFAEDLAHPTNAAGTFHAVAISNILPYLSMT